MRQINLTPYLSIISVSLFISFCYGQNCPSLNVVGGFNNITTFPQSYTDAQNEGNCYTFESPYDSVICFEYQVPFSDTVQFSLHLNCGGTSSINSGTVSGGCSSLGTSNSTFTGIQTFDSNCDLIGNFAAIGYCGGAQSGDILTMCFSINTDATCGPINICPTAFCGEGSCMVPNPLPINLVSFNGDCENNKNILYWTTASEANNDFFTIEKTHNGEVFETVGVVNGAGNSTETNSYKFEDLTTNSARTSYYRLKQTDFDGTYTYSDIISVRCEGNKGIKVFPNPSNSVVSIESESTIDNVLIINNIGETIANKFINESVKKTTIDVNSFAKGIYLLQVELENGEVVKEKLIVN